jgi:LuxR family maltose regulon positive regulatory protein
LQTVQDFGRQGVLIEILTLQALAYQALGQASQAQAELSRALALAEPEGYIRLFVDLGEGMRQLVEASRRVAPAYADLLLAHFPPLEADQATGSRLASGGLIEPLNERELEILRLITAGYSNQVIANQLVVAVSTVKWHINNLYAKLGVHSRTQALAKARELGLM